MTNATNPTNTNNAATQMMPVYQVQAKPNGVWVDVDAEQYADYEKQLSRYQVRTLYSAPGPVSVPAIVLNQLRHRISEMREAAYTYGDYSKDAVDSALSGVLDTIDELEDAAPVPPEPDEETSANSWRRLALQFDHHRMQGLHHLRAMVQDPVKHMEHAIAFLNAGPLSGEVVLAERIAAIASKVALRKISQLLTDRGEAPLDEVRCVLTQIKEHTAEEVISDYAGEAVEWLDVAQAIISGAAPDAKPDTRLTADECFVALSWLSIARTRINFGEADEALLAKLGAICPNAALDVQRQVEFQNDGTPVSTDVSAVLALINYCADWCREVPQAMVDNARAAFLAAGPNDVQDAERWRAFIGSARIQPQGNAGLDGSELNPYGKPWNGYAHMGLEIWTKYSRDFSAELLEKMDRSTATGREWLTRYADVAVAARRAAMAEQGVQTCGICHRVLDNPQDPVSQNCGGHCLQCMADAGDPDAAAAVAELPKAN